MKHDDEVLHEAAIITANDGVIWVSSITPTKKLASCIFASAINEKREEVKLRGIGAGANNQMTKGYIVAKGKLVEKGISTTVDIAFTDIEPDDMAEGGKDKMTAIEYTLKFKK